MELHEKYAKVIYCIVKKVRNLEMKQSLLPFDTAEESHPLTMSPAFQFGSEHSKSLQIVL